MPRWGVLLIATLALSSGARAADEPGRLEVGFVPLSVSYVSAEESLTGIQVPAAGSMFLTGERGLYLQDSDTNPTAGGGLGFRQPIRSAGSLRVEAGYERMFGDGWDADTFKVSIGLALRI
jgi:hypothetical protein